LQYNPQALQFNSSFNPLLHNGVCVAPQLEHSAFCPPGALLLFNEAAPPPLAVDLNEAEEGVLFKDVTVALGIFDLVETLFEEEVRTVKFGRGVVDLPRDDEEDEVAAEALPVAADFNF
jgi:hypothetical protein